MIIGVTGGIGSGKSTIVHFFKEFFNVAVYIADVEAKKLIDNSVVIQKKIIDNFGKEAYVNNKLNNRYLANIVFNHTEKLAILNGIIHPEVRNHFLEFYNNHKNKKSYVIFESALLFETRSNKICDKIICVFAPLEVRIKRVIERDCTERQEVMKRISNQLPQEKKILQSHYLINNIDLETSKNRVLEIHNILTKKTH